MAFSNLTESENFNVVNIAVVDNEQYQKSKEFRDFIEQHSEGLAGDNSSEQLFIAKVVSQEEAEKMLANNEIVGYVTYGNPISLSVKESGFDQTILKEIFDQYSQTESTVYNILDQNPTALQNGLTDDLQRNTEFTREVQIGTKDKPDITVNYFYTLIAMTCFYFGCFGQKEITNTQANLSKRAARLNVAPVHKLKVLTAGVLASLLISLIEVAFLMCYIIFVLKIDFGNQTALVLLTCIVGCACGISFGAFISVVNKKSEGVKTAILIVSTMTACFLSGMMFDKMKYIIQKNIPILAYINPVSLITDAFYALYYYDTYTRFLINIGMLSGFTVLFCLVTYFVMRRQRYDYI